MSHIFERGVERNQAARGKDIRISFRGRFNAFLHGLLDLLLCALTEDLAVDVSTDDYISLRFLPELKDRLRINNYCDLS